MNPEIPLPPAAHDAALPTAVTGTGGVRVRHGVPYAAIPGVRPLELDIYLPPDASSAAPLVVFLHGGGWRAGSRHSVGPAFRHDAVSPLVRLAHRGMAVASIDYRLSGEARWPAPLHDAKAAVRWLRSRAAELGIDGDRIAAWGESAGGHLAALLGLTGPDLDGDVGVTGPASSVDAVVAWYAPADLATSAEDIGADPMAADSREARLLGAPPPTVPESTRQASPVSHVHSGAPPFLLLHGTSDRLVACRQSERLRDALRAAGTSVHFEAYAGADHLWLGSATAARSALDRTTEFLLRHAGRTGPGPGRS